MPNPVDISQITVTSGGNSVTANLHDSQIPDVNEAIEAILDGGGIELTGQISKYASMTRKTGDIILPSITTSFSKSSTSSATSVTSTQEHFIVFSPGFIFDIFFVWDHLDWEYSCTGTVTLSFSTYTRSSSETYSDDFRVRIGYQSVSAGSISYKKTIAQHSIKGIVPSQSSEISFDFSYSGLLSELNQTSFNSNNNKLYVFLSYYLASGTLVGSTTFTLSNFQMKINPPSA